MKFKKPVVVVEIGNDWLKILESITFPLGGYIDKASFTKLAQIKESVAEAISRIFKDSKLNKQFVITYIPRHLVTVRILELPSTDPREINDMISLQIGKQTPYSKEEIVSANKIVDSEREGYTKAMLVIARRNLISERVETLRKAGVEVQKVAVSTEGVYNWFGAAYMPELKLDDSQTVAIVDIDSNYSDFIAIRKKKLAFTRNIFIGANHLIQEQEPWQDKFIEELKRSIERYQNEEGAVKVKIEKIFLSGAARCIKDLEHVVSARLDVPTEVADCLKNISVRKGFDVLKEDNLKLISVSPLVGVAIRHNELALDLTPRELRVEKVMEAKRKNLTVMGILVASIAMILSLLLSVNIYNRSAYLAQLKNKISQIEKNANKVEKMRMEIALIRERLDAKATSINILNEIYKLTPKEIHFTDINIEEKKQAVLKGLAVAMSDVFKFVTVLENSHYFENVKTTYTTTKKDENTEYASFEIICTHEEQ